MDEFSFPTVVRDQREEPLYKLPFPHFWFTPQEEKKPTQPRRRSFSSGERGAEVSKALTRNLVMHSPTLSDQQVGYEERMDMLWEDFNEELHRMSGDHRREATMEKKSRANQEEANDARGSENNVEFLKIEGPFCWVPALNPPPKARMIDRRRPSLLVMLKVLKKLFTIQRTRSSKKIEGNHRAKYK